MLCLLPPTLLAFAPGLTPKPHFARSLVSQQGRAFAPVRLDLHGTGIVPWIDDSAVVPIAAAALAFLLSAAVVSKAPKTAESPPPLPPPSPPSPDPALAEAKAAAEKKAREAEVEASAAEKNARELEAARAEATKKAKEAEAAEAAAEKAREVEFVAAAAERKAREVEAAAAAAERRELGAAKAAAEIKAKGEAAPPPAPKEVVNPWGSQLPPTWTDLTQVPVRVPNQAAWNSLGRAKQLAILCRLSVVHLTLISCGVPCMLAGATGSATGLVAPLVWVVTLSLWHLSHNLINDVQDLRRGLDRVQYAFRLQYSSHPLAVMFAAMHEAMHNMHTKPMPPSAERVMLDVLTFT